MNKFKLAAMLVCAAILVSCGGGARDSISEPPMDPEAVYPPMERLDLETEAQTCPEGSSCKAYTLAFGTSRYIEDDDQDFNCSTEVYTGYPSMNSYGQTIVTVPTTPDARAAGEIPRTRKMGEEVDKSKFFSFQEAELLSRDEFIALLGALRSDRENTEAVVFIHGFNVDFCGAAFRAAQIKHDTGYEGEMLFYSWPSDASLFNYLGDREDAIDARPYLTEFFDTVIESGSFSKIHIVAHSMGNLVTVGSLTEMAETDPDKYSQAIGHAIFASADVSRQEFTERYPAIDYITDSITFYASDDDWALKISDAIRVNSGARVGAINAEEGAYIVPGAETIDLSEIAPEKRSIFSMDPVSYNHRKYSSSATVLDDVHKVVRGVPDDPCTRSEGLIVPLPQETGPYWLFGEAPAACE